MGCTVTRVPGNEITVLLVDDHPLVRMGLAQVLAAAPGLLVVGQCGRAEEVPAAIEAHDPDVVVLDLMLGAASGLELIPRLVADHPHLAILVLSMHDVRVYGERCRRAGARGYLMKEAAAQQVEEAVRAVAGGEAWNLPGGTPAEGVGTLSDRELRVFELTGDGQATRAIAAALGLSEKTVEAHKANIKRKLGIASAAELARMAAAWRTA